MNSKDIFKEIEKFREKKEWRKEFQRRAQELINNLGILSWNIPITWDYLEDFIKISFKLDDKWITMKIIDNPSGPWTTGIIGDKKFVDKEDMYVAIGDYYDTL